MLKNKLFLIFWLFFTFSITKAQAQIVPDQTLERESSIVTPVDELNDEIKGGATRGSNLFHSFTEFNVGEGRGADFVNPDSIDNIITRVTGNNISNIFGKLGVLGNANLFLINPNGIIFGEGARLDISGSFYGSTAESILFSDKVEFSATNPQTSILTINVPIGLGLGNNPGVIINQSTANNSNGLEVKPEANLTLVGGDIKFDGGQVTAPGGRVELGGLSAAGIVTLKENGSLSFPQNVERADITLTNAAEIDVRAEVGEGDAGAIKIVASGDITIQGQSPNSSRSRINSIVGTKAEGNAGEINVVTANLSLTDGGRINVSTFGKGNAGAITITASGNILVAGEDTKKNPSGILSEVSNSRTAVGNAGNIEILSTNLSLIEGGRITTGTFRRGDAGDITITAQGNILIQGENKKGNPSGILSNVRRKGVGNAGGISINTNNLSITQGGVITTGTEGQGDAGKITIVAKENILVQGEGLNGDRSQIVSTGGIPDTASIRDKLR